MQDKIMYLEIIAGIRRFREIAKFVFIAYPNANSLNSRVEIENDDVVDGP